MAVKVLILEDNPVARSFLCRVVRESFSDSIAITEAGDLESARREPQRNAQALAELASWYAQGRIKPVIDQKLPMQALPQAFTRMGSRQVRGKLVLTNG